MIITQHGPIEQKLWLEEKPSWVDILTSTRITNRLDVHQYELENSEDIDQFLSYYHIIMA